MFHRLGKIVVCYRVLIICLWLGLTAGMLFAPSLRSVGTADETSFLPTGAESMTARQLAADEFPSGAVDSAGVLVFFNPDGLSERDRAYAEEVATWLATAGPREVGQVVSAFGHPEMRDLLVSRDGRTMLLQVSFNVAPFHEPANQAVAAIRERVGDAPPGLEVRVTGEAGIGADFLAAINRSTSRATVVTVALVVLVVLLVYRSPVAALVPLATVGVAFLTSRGLLGLLAAAGLNVSSLLDSFLVVLVFGVGTDYSLFIISRYREELAGRDRTAAATETVGRMGPVIVSSAATVIIGLLSLGVASYRLTRTIGPAMGLAVAVTLSASLTLTPALFSLFGRRLFWPFAESAGTAEGRGFWFRLAGAVTRRPIVVSLVALTLLVLPMARLPAMVLSFNLLAELPATTDSVRGFTIIAEHFEQGDMMPVSVLIQAPSDLTEAAGLARTVKLTKALEAVPGVERVVAVTSPTADEASGHRLTVPGQLSALVTGLEQGLNPGEGLVIDAEVIASPAATQGLEMMRVYLDDLGRSFPGLRDDPDYQKATGALGALGRALADARRGARPDNQLRLLADGLGAATAASAVPSEGASLAELTAGFVQLEVVPSYLSELAAQFPALLDNPAYADAVSALVELDRVKQALSVDGQLLEMAAQLRTSAGAVGDGEVAAMGGRAGADDSAGPFGGLRSYLEGLARAYPDLVSDQDYREAMATLTDLERTLTDLQAAGRAFSFQAPLAFLSPAAQDHVRAGRDRIVGAPAALAAGLKRLGDETEALAATFAAGPEAYYLPAGMGARQAAATGTFESKITGASEPTVAIADLPGRLATDFEALARAFEGDDDRPFLPVSLLATPAGKAMTEAFTGQVTSLRDGLLTLRAEFLRGDPVYFLPRSLATEESAGSLLSLFYSADRRTMRLLVVAGGDPYSPAAFKAVTNLRQVLRTELAGEGWDGARAYVGGSTAEFSDISRLVNRDFRAVLLTVVAGVFVIMAILLRSLVAPAYLVLSVLLSYGTALGLSALVFQDLLHHPGVNYVIPIVVLVLLVALGADYNIFLMARVREEAEGKAVKEGVRRAAAVTGGIITACGLILAGSFAALTAAPMRLLFQVGATVAMGVLVDTFLIRAVLIPALASSLGRWNWWPGGRERPAARPDR